MDWGNIRGRLGRSNEKYRFYFGDYTYNDPTNTKVASLIGRAHVGWGKRAVEMRANKTHFDCFENDTMGLNELFAKYRVKEALDMVKEDVLVGGCGFLVLAGDRVMPFNSQEATGTFDWHEQNLKDGVAVFRDETKRIKGEMPNAYMKFTANETTSVEDGVVTITPNVIGRPLMGVLTHKSTTMRPFGRSVLSKPARDAIVDASRTVRQAMIAAHYYNSKVDVLLGVDGSNDVNTLDRKTGDVLMVGTNEEGQMPQIGEFAQHAMAPFNDTIMTAARNFCSDTKLSLVNLGITSDAPQSTEALEIVNDDLRDSIQEWHRELGEQLKYFAVTLWMYENEIRNIDDNLRERIEATVPVWKSIYRTDISKAGDGIMKLAQIAPNIVESRTIWRNLGLTSAEIDNAIQSAKNAQNMR